MGAILRRLTVCEAARHCLDLWAASVGDKGARDRHGAMLVLAYGRTGGRAATDEESYCSLLVEDTPGYTALRPFLHRIWVEGIKPRRVWQAQYRARVTKNGDARRSLAHADYTGILSEDLSAFESRVGQAWLEQAALSSVEDLE